MSTYAYNPRCHCPWCTNHGTNPTPGNPATLGYDEPHIPAIRLNDRDLRYVWLRAALIMARDRNWPDAKEAWRNAHSDRPPERWRTGVHITGLDRTAA